MYRPGHYGVALALYSPISFLLVAGGLADRALVGGIALLAMTMLPDLDSKTERVRHRGPTHSLAFAAAVGLVAGVVGGLLAGPWFAGFGASMGLLAVVAHLVADVLTPMGIRPFWPVSDRHYTLDLTLSSDSAANYLLFVGGSVLCGGAWFLGGLY
ncbi:metal-dependent hydrolase [Haladaptatus salinisoli]|uniref:metal-dependent hydrolase n=1 Tax=Haladaptatus salinisoli TaxID=2884876 RepID=UPI001D0BA2D1|nr:metal-dependent hydrolase [Haladaptatus salinisoli]